MRRREFIGLVSGAIIVRPFAARAQRASAPVIGFLNTQSSTDSASWVAAFRKGLRQTDFTEGENVIIEYRWAEGRYDRLPSLATDLLGRKVSVIVAAYLPAVLAAKSLTSTVPIVFISGLDPVASGLVASLNRPGGNLTGISNYNTALVAKQIELIHQVAGENAAIGLMVNPTTPVSKSMEAEGGRAASALGVRLIPVRVSTEEDIDSGFNTLTHEHAGALVVGGDSFLSSRLDRIAALAAQHKLPAIYDRREDTVSGGLMSYGTDVSDLYRQAGIYAGRILKGEKPSELPVEEATKIELVVNLKAARKLGVELPTAIVLRADEVIE